MAPLNEAARLLYDGPWVAERTAALKDLLHNDPEAIHPVVREIVEKGFSFSAVEAFEGGYRLAELARAVVDHHFLAARSREGHHGRDEAVHLLAAHPWTPTPLAGTPSEHATQEKHP